MSKISSITKTGATEPWELQVSRGQIQGHSVQNIFGYNTSVSAGDFIPAWFLPQSYIYPVSAINMTVHSNVTADVGTTVKITGLDSNYDEITEIVTVDLTATANTTTQKFLRVNDLIHLNTDGNDGTIQVVNGGTVYGGIRPKEGKAQSAVYTVPRGHSFYLNRISAFSADSTAGKPAIFNNFTSNPEGVNLNVARSTFNGSMNIERQYPFKYTEKTDIQGQLKSLSGTHEMSVFFEGILIQEDSDVGT